MRKNFRFISVDNVRQGFFLNPTTDRLELARLNVAFRLRSPSLRVRQSLEGFLLTREPGNTNIDLVNNTLLPLASLNGRHTDLLDPRHPISPVDFGGVFGGILGALFGKNCPQTSIRLNTGI